MFYGGWRPINSKDHDMLLLHTQMQTWNSWAPVQPQINSSTLSSPSPSQLAMAGTTCPAQAWKLKFFTQPKPPATGNNCATTCPFKKCKMFNLCWLWMPANMLGQLILFDQQESDSKIKLKDTNTRFLCLVFAPNVKVWTSIYQISTCSMLHGQCATREVNWVFGNNRMGG